MYTSPTVQLGSSPGLVPGWFKTEVADVEVCILSYEMFPGPLMLTHSQCAFPQCV